MISWPRWSIRAVMATAWLVAAAPPFGDAVSWTGSASGSFTAPVGQFCIIAANIEVELDDEGFVTAEIAFPPGLRPGVTVDKIDLASVTIQVEGGAAAIHAVLSPSAVEDEDGIRVREVNFRRAEVLTLLNGRAGIVRLIVSGNVNGCRFSGSDTIRVEDPPPACTWYDRACSAVLMTGVAKSTHSRSAHSR